MVISKSIATWANADEALVPRRGPYVGGGRTGPGLSHADDLDQSPEAVEVVRISRVERKSVGMRGRGDEQVGNAATMETTDPQDCGDDLTIAAGSRGIEGDGVEGRLNLLQASLSTCPFVTGRGEMRPSGQFGKSDGADRRLVGKCGSDGGVIPLDEHGRVEQAEGHLQALIDHAIEVGSEFAEVHVRSRSTESNEVRLRHEFPSWRRNRTELGYRDAIASHDEGFSRGYRVDDLGVVVPQLPLGDRLGHDPPL